MIRLKDLNPEAPVKRNKDRDDMKLEKLSLQLESLQEILFAEHKHRVLVILQGMDTSGKDGTIKTVFKSVNPAHVRVASFKAPTTEEVDRDFLWRVHKKVPASGELVIFNRSHYEAVLVERVHRLVSPAVWKQRYRQINDFEKLLSETGTTIIKFFLHISKAEQKKRLQDRFDDREKQWKFNEQDLVERALWTQYQKAYEDVLNLTHQPHAPWHIIPANQKWYRNLRISEILVDRLQGLKLRFPQRVDRSRIVIK